MMIVLPMIDIELAREKAGTGDCAGAIEDWPEPSLTTNSQRAR